MAKVYEFNFIMQDFVRSTKSIRYICFKLIDELTWMTCGKFMISRAVDKFVTLISGIVRLIDPWLLIVIGSFIRSGYIVCRGIVTNRIGSERNPSASCFAHTLARTYVIKRVASSADANNFGFFITAFYFHNAWLSYASSAK